MKDIHVISRALSVAGRISFHPIDSLIDGMCDLHIKACKSSQESSCLPYPSPS